MKNYIYIATSLDGFIARKDGSIDWLTDIPNPSGSDYGFSEFIDGIDALVMGRNTYETVLSFGIWPYDKKVFVLSSTIKEIPEHLEGKVQIISGDIEAVLEKLRGEGYKSLYIDGGQVIQSCLKKDLIDKMIITTIPILIGSGIRLFGELKNDLKFEIKETELLDNQMLKITYERLKTKLS